MDDLEVVQEKIFNIIEVGNTNTVIYRIDRDFSESVIKYTIEKLDSTIEFSVENRKKRTFFINNLQPDGNLILILTFTDNKVIINSGIVDDKKIIISKKTIPIKTQILHSQDKSEFNEFVFTSDIKRQVAVLDIETLDEITPVLYLDKETNQVKGKFNLEPNKVYFEFEIIDDKI